MKLRRLWKQHPPIVAWLELGGDGMGAGCGQVGRGGVRGGLAARQAARAQREGHQVLWGEGWIKQINT